MYRAICDNCGYSIDDPEIGMAAHLIMPHMNQSQFYCWYKEGTFSIQWLDLPPRKID